MSQLPNEPEKERRRHRNVSGAARAALLVLLVGLAACSRGPRLHGALYEPARPAAEITGTNWDGSTFRLNAQVGKVVLLFFGYTNCPDVCPTTLAEMRVLTQNLSQEQASRVAVVFVSVDPERDTVARLREYIPVFSDRFYGLYLEPDALEKAKADYGVIAEKHYYKPEETAAGYSVDHTARVYLVDSGSMLRTSYPYGTPVENIEADVIALLR